MRGKTMRLLAVSLIFASTLNTFCIGKRCAAQPTKHLADFKLTISIKDEAVRSQMRPMNIIVRVKETNISKHIVNVGRTNEPGQWYRMSVVLDGHPAPL